MNFHIKPPVNDPESDFMFKYTSALITIDMDCNLVDDLGVVCLKAI